MRGIRERQADPEVLRPEHALHADGRIERVRQRLQRDVERAIRIVT
jgi:hypothetical protein